MENERKGMKSNASSKLIIGVCSNFASKMFYLWIEKIFMITMLANFKLNFWKCYLKILIKKAINKSITVVIKAEKPALWYEDLPE